MFDFRLWAETDPPAGFRQALAEIKLLVEVEEPRIKTADLDERSPPDQQCRSHGILVHEVPEAPGGTRIGHWKCRYSRPARGEDPRVRQHRKLSRPIGVQERRCDERDVPSLLDTRQELFAGTGADDCVGIEEEEELRRRRARAQIACCPETDVPVERQESCGRESLAYQSRTSVQGRVVHDDDIDVMRQRGQAACEVLAGLE